MKPCIHCGAVLQNNAATCSKCRRPVVDALTERRDPVPQRPVAKLPSAAEGIPACAVLGAIVGAFVDGWTGAGIGALVGLAFGVLGSVGDIG